MTSTDVEMGGVSAAEDLHQGLETTSSIVEEVLQAEAGQKKKRARPLCGKCQLEVSIPKQRQNREKRAANAMKLVAFRKCQEAKNNTLAFNALKRALADLLVSKITGRFRDEENVKFAQIESELARLAPIIDEIQERRKSKRRSTPKEPLPTPDENKEEEYDEQIKSEIKCSSPLTQVPSLISDVSDMEAETDDFDDPEPEDDPGRLSVHYRPDPKDRAVSTVLQTLKHANATPKPRQRSKPIGHDEGVQLPNMESRKKRVRATPVTSKIPLKRTRV